MTDYVAYYRVSTKMQGRSGLGLEAQMATVKLFAGGQSLLGEFQEVESGRRKTRPELANALELANSRNATLIVAKLDRLSRNAKFLLEIVESGVSIIFCDFPQMPQGPMQKFFLTMMAAVAELESGMISDRTKAALAAAKRRGVRLGTAGPQRAAINRLGALERALELKPTLTRFRKKGIHTCRDIADALNAEDKKTEKGGRWHSTSVHRLLKRIRVVALPPTPFYPKKGVGGRGLDGSCRA